MKLTQARAIAQFYVEQMEPYCHRIEIAGSVRRGAPAVKDIELVVIPRWAERPARGNLFDEDLTDCVNLLHDWAENRSPQAKRLLTWIKPGTSDILPWRIDPHGRYWRGWLLEGIKLDLFIATPQTWGYQLMLRTGSAEFNQAVARYALTVGKRYSEDWMRGTIYDRMAPQEEADAFEKLGLEYIEPARRAGENALRVMERELTPV